MAQVKFINASFGSWAINVLMVIILSHEFDWPEMICDRAKMNFASHRVRRLFGE